jgi:sialic acid synthase SpsE
MSKLFRTDPYIIAEVGSCHDGSLSMALLIIESAANSGVDAVKFQVYNAQRLSVRRNAQPFREQYAHYQLPHEWLPQLKAQAKAHGVDFVLSVYDLQDLEVASQYADILKVSSFEASDFRLIEACHVTGKSVIVSTGMADRLQLLQAHVRLERLDNILMLHCVSAYPTTMKDLNLSTIKEYNLDGFSDHSRNTLTGALAVCQGARILEVHVRAYSTKAESPDAPHSLDPGQLFEYVRNAQQAKLSIGTPRMGVLPCEEKYAGFKVRERQA